MKILIALSSCIMFVLFASCKRQNQAESLKDKFKSATVSYISSAANERYAIDKKESVLMWKGSMVFANKGGHTGYINIFKGELMIEKNQLAGGTVEVDMNSIADEIHGSDNELVKHLKSPDFFDASKFPLSRFTITKIAPSYAENITVRGNL